MIDTAEKGRLERERLVEVRKENYAAKMPDPQCHHEGCDADSQLLVTENFSVLCPAHLTGTVRPGQWNDRSSPLP